MSIEDRNDSKGLALGFATGPSSDDGAAGVSALRASVPSAEHPTDAFTAWAIFKKLMREDAEYAWAWHCNLAVPIMDATNVSHKSANEAAAYLMRHLFEYDITTHPQYGYGKTTPQEYYEMRVTAEREEDAQAIEARRAETTKIDSVHESAVSEGNAPKEGSHVD